MKRSVFTITVCSNLLLAAGATLAGSPQPRSNQPTDAEIHQKAMQEGPSTMQAGYLTQKDPVGPHRNASPVNPELLRPLTTREIGMLYNACIAYPECKVAYGKAQEHNQALLNAQKAGDDSGQ
jgi:hypothetical protein